MSKKTIKMKKDMGAEAYDFLITMFRETLDNCVKELIFLKAESSQDGWIMTNDPEDYSPPQRLFIKTFLSELHEISGLIDKTTDEEKCQQKT